MLQLTLANPKDKAAFKFATHIIIKTSIEQTNSPEVQVSVIQQLTQLVTKIHRCQVTSSFAC